MRLSLLVMCFLFLTSKFVFAQNLLDSLTWKNRVVLIFSPNLTDKTLQKQIVEIKNDLPGHQERDLKVFFVLPDRLLDFQQKKLSEKDYTHVKERFHLSSKSFQFILIGKDGGQKMSASQLVPNPKLFAIIDAMPMRKVEINKKSNKHN